MSLAEGVVECVGCGEQRDGTEALLKGRHFMTKCKKGRRNKIHDKVRDTIHEMYISMGVGAEKEPGGLYAQLGSNGEFRPADVLVPASATESGKAQGLDVTITDPTTKTSLEKESDINPLKAAAEAHRRKMEVHARHVAMSPGELPFDKVPLAFETTGAMGVETQKWWKEVLKLEADCGTRGENDAANRMLQGMACTWTATRFESYWMQAISMAQAREQAETVDIWINKCQPQRVEEGTNND